MNFRLHIGELWNLYWSFKQIIFFNYTEGSMSSIKHYNVQKKLENRPESVSFCWFSNARIFP